ncbi:ArsR/SmtB family transcription factor [Devosia sp.]|uniref:ArsR/SmtB family transcription factor n=1 Tax=Devosia sp. TaxID=1871048 RepID=UPI003F729DA1
MSLADLYSALADPTRLRVLELLHGQARPVHDLAAAFEISRPAISRHLRVLKEAGLVQEEKQGRENLYSFQRDELKAGIAWLETHQKKPGRAKKIAVVEAVAPVAPAEAPALAAEPIAHAEPAAMLPAPSMAHEPAPAVSEPVPVVLEPVAVVPDTAAEPIVLDKPKAAKPRATKTRVVTELVAPPPPQPAPQLSLFDF